MRDFTEMMQPMACWTESQKVIGRVAPALRNVDHMMKVEREDSPTGGHGAAITGLMEDRHLNCNRNVTPPLSRHYSLR
jgi:hypothetical protein